MRIFISYGHNDHVALVNAVFDELKKAGHEPWKDDRYEYRENKRTSGIIPGEDFTQVIYDAIDACDFVLAFVTAKTYNSPYCRDERQYAYNHKGSRFIQLRMDGMDIRLGNAGSYLDMDAAENSDGTLNRILLEERMQAIFAAFRDPSTLIGPSATFERHLKIAGAVQYEEFVHMPEREDFVGRQWLKEQCKRWVLDDRIPCRLFVILGEAGTGKTAFVRYLAADKELVRSVHVCVFDRPKTRNVEDALKNLAYTLTLTNTDYCEYLKNKSLDNLSEMDHSGLFQFLFVDPLKNEKEKYLLIIDGLDELEEKTGFNPLIKVLRQFACQLNPNISILVTARPEENIISKIHTVNARADEQSVRLTRENGREDLNAFIRQNLLSLHCHTDALQEKILQACDGNFEYLTLLFREAAEEGLDLTADISLPRGLQERYIQYLDRRMEMHGHPERFTKTQRLLLSILSVAYEPIPQSLLADAAGMDVFDVEEELALFGTLIRRAELPDHDLLVSFFSKGFRDFLLSGHCRPYTVSAEVGTQAMAEYLMQHVNTPAALQALPYMDRHGFTHLLLSMQKSRVAGDAYLARMWEADRDCAEIHFARALCAGEEGAAAVFAAPETGGAMRGCTVQRLKFWRAIDALWAIVWQYEVQGRTVWQMILQADVLYMNPTPQVLAEAEGLYRRAWQMVEAAYVQEPDEENRHELSVICDRLGIMCRDKHTPEGRMEAEQWFRKELELDEQNHRENPCYDTRRSLSITYDRLGKLSLSKSTPEGNTEAEQWFRKKLELDEQNHHENPCYDTRRNLSITYDRLGDLSLSKSTPEGNKEAEQWFRKRLELDEQNHHENPCYNTRRSLSVTYDRLGKLSRSKSTPEGRMEAEQWFRKMLELDEQNYRENPCYQTRRSLSITYDRLGDLSLSKSTPEGRMEAEQWFRKKLELDEQNHHENPCYQTRRDLSVTYDRLGKLSLSKSTPEGNREAEQWFRKELELAEQNYWENSCYDTRRDLSATYDRLGNLSLSQSTPEGNKEAEQWFRKELELDEQNHHENPCYNTRRSLSITYDRLGDLSLSKPTPEGRMEAEQWFRKELELAEQNYRENPCYDTRRALSVTYERLGDLSRSKSTPEGNKEAEQWFRKELELAEQNMRENPCYDTRRFISVIYERLGDLSLSKSTPEGNTEAEQWFRKKLELAEQNHHENPCYETRRSLSITYGRLGDLSLSKSTPEGNMEAEQWFRKELELDEQNYRENPGYDSRRTLSIAYCKLGKAAEAGEGAAALAEAEQWYQQGLLLDEINFRQHPGPQSREDLKSTYAVLYFLAKKKGTPEGEKEADIWERKYFELEE